MESGFVIFVSVKGVDLRLSQPGITCSNRNTRTRCEIYSEFTIKTTERREWCRSGVFIVNFDYISRLVLVANFEQANAGWITMLNPL